MQICEIFASIQGESSHVGYPCVFVRLSGCNLRCEFCDTTYSYEGGEEISVDDVIKRATSYNIGLIEVTGGEPLLQQEVYDLMGLLLNRGYQLLLETNGSISIERVDSRVNIVLDMKAPSSKMSDRMFFNNLEIVSKKDDVKFVLGGREDYEWAKTVIAEYRLLDKTNVLLAPVFGVLEPENLVSWMVQDSLRVRLNLQLHKYIFNPNMRGV